jgi:Tfp pilus assembly protein PilF
LQLQRVNLLLEAGRRSEARAMLSDVVRIAPSQSAEARNARIALADVALSEADHRGALDALSGVDEVSYERHSRLGFAYGGLGRHELASQSFGTAFHLAISANQRALMARSQIDSLAQLTRREEAKALLLRYLANGALAPAKPLEIAYLATATGADSTAHEYFSRAESEGSLVGSAFLDAAYTARRLDENDAALRYFRAAISADRAGTLSLEPQSRLNVTREVVNLERDFGGYISVVRSPTAAFAGATPGSRDATYVGGEFYWQPLAYDNSVELFVRGFETLAADEGATGSETLQGYVGARWRPVLGTTFFSKEVISSLSAAQRGKIG